MQIESINNLIWIANAPANCSSNFDLCHTFVSHTEVEPKLSALKYMYFPVFKALLLQKLCVCILKRNANLIFSSLFSPFPLSLFYHFPAFRNFIAPFAPHNAREIWSHVTHNHNYSLKIDSFIFNVLARARRNYPFAYMYTYKQKKHLAVSFLFSPFAILRYKIWTFEVFFSLFMNCYFIFCCLVGSQKCEK
jgi:hypothetical protein